MTTYYQLHGFKGEPLRYEALGEAVDRAKRAARENPGSEFTVYEVKLMAIVGVPMIPVVEFPSE